MKKLKLMCLASQFLNSNTQKHIPIAVFDYNEYLKNCKLKKFIVRQVLNPLLIDQMPLKNAVDAP